MKEALIDRTLHVDIHDVRVPTPGPGQILIKTIISGTNPKDWKVPKVWAPQLGPFNHGDDIAGYVESVGEDVLGFCKGDRVAAFHEMGTPHGSYAEYSIAWATSAFHVHRHTTLEEVATVPLAAMTAALGLYQRLDLPLPWSPATNHLPLIIYGGATAVGSFAIKLASLSNIHPIITVAGNGVPYVETLINKEKGDVVIDYRKGHPILHALDGVSENETLRTIDKVLGPGRGKITNFLQNFPSDVSAEIFYTTVGTVHAQDEKLGDKAFGAAFFPFFGRGLAEGWFSGHPHEVLSGGLGALEEALKDLEAGKVSSKKLLLRIADTEGSSA
ncbi:quinone oxidoreductase [Colletotrichum tofieldiae]|uniref:Quinone oxidoreductase n=1 Tax=Colletotrichum tofieldiae TaxID=708197 RepID=A0A166XPA1_9PEZI|nr:quinone oxidoreductase [Colletotrichum tofieldiae]GKT56245.1 quinone oxidoreductase [Colletotrichum tofieldiae]GKT76784.1 quinone oxidoreductase [Colletotrichum tofieldiae]GKT97442.1 quinone oxidoreductase [Colletotrichum tofieldiae]